MFRLLGFCFGSIVSLAALVLLIGMPEFHLASDDVDLARFDAAVDKLRAKQLLPQPETVVAKEPADPAESPAATEATQAAAPSVPETAGLADDVAVGDSTVTADADPDPDKIAVPDADPLPNADADWHVLWTPFRSEIAARGFVSRLESVTGLDYRVVKLGNGVYEVAVPYRDDTELSAKLSQISSATGLDLSGSLP